jgi:hypothetical protein
MSPTSESVIQRLDAARQKWWLVTLLTTALLAGCVSLALFLGFMFADALFRLPQSGLLVSFIGWLAVSLGLMVLVGRRLLRGQRTLEAAARRVEVEFPQLGSDLINLVQLGERVPAGPFGEAAVRQAAARIGGVRFDHAPAQESRWRRFRWCMQTTRDLVEAAVVLGLLILVAAACSAWIPNWGSAASRLLTPWSFVPSRGLVEIVSVEPGEADVLVGTSVEIVAKIKNPDGKPPGATLVVLPEGKSESRSPMTSDSNHERFTSAVPSVVKAFSYRLEIGDSQTRWYRIAVREKAIFDSVEVTYRYPRYLDRDGRTAVGTGLDLEAPQYTVAELRIRPSAAVVRGGVELDGRQHTGRVEEGGKLLIVSVPMFKNGSYVVRLVDEAGHVDPDPRVNRIAVTPDLPPSVALVKPARQATASPGETLDVMIRAGDDHGLDRVRLEIKVQTADSDAATGAATTVKEWTDFAEHSVTSAARRYSLKPDPTRAKPGETVLLRAVAVDARTLDDWGLDLKPQETAGPWHAVRIVAGDDQASAALERLDALRTAIWGILERQLRARAQSASLLEKRTADERAALVTAIRTEQVGIQKSTAEAASSIGSDEKAERPAMRRTLQTLASGEMVSAVALCDGLAKLPATADCAKPAGELTASQDRIVESLRKLLDAVRQAREALAAEMNKRLGGDLPNDARQKFAEARDKLENFLEQQKKVIEATKDLAKTPVEDFTEVQKELLGKVAAAEDDWAKFMEELHSDLSKLPEQDFANSSSVKELVEIQTELKMAADALLKKSADIAVPLEQLGYERAEELKTNFEKWLPDSPDREKWSQEESLTDQDKETPMAELPGELEDMVGELMEQEEDLFDEMEDVSSSAADSLDKGAGWDATDGPISNMSAKGVTGNRLPNTSEIGGRSGEGRQGKSSGEFVGEESVGKGGRRTPSRLTPDPYVKGQIKDHGKQSAGGATGGGKESGKGGEGLEGPSPGDTGPRTAERLAAKQAALRNKAEAIDLRMEVTRFQHTDLRKMIETMAQVERDLKAGRYPNALRQRHVLAEWLGNVKQYLEGEFEVRRDATANVPTDVQKKILGAMQDPSPAGWEEMNRRYFERLTGGEKGKGERGE